MIAVLIPCLNEEKTVAQVVRKFRDQLPQAEVHVFDNASTDATAREALRAGAIVHREDRRGKGFVVQRMFREVDADVYVMVDGDDTYPAEQVHELLRPVLEGEADMAVGSRFLSRGSQFRSLNRLGNQFFIHVINWIFGTHLTDILSGYRAMSRRFVSEVPIFVKGFEVEAELTAKALERGLVIREVPSRLSPRPPGSHSKLRRFRDGFRILAAIVAIVRDYRPLTVFGVLAAALVLLGLVPGLVVVGEYLRTGLVARLPSAVLSIGLELSGLVLGASGLILHTINRRIQELEAFVRQGPAEARGRVSAPVRRSKAA